MTSENSPQFLTRAERRAAEQAMQKSGFFGGAAQPAPEPVVPAAEPVVETVADAPVATPDNMGFSGPVSDLQHYVASALPAQPLTRRERRIMEQTGQLPTLPKPVEAFATPVAEEPVLDEPAIEPAAEPTSEPVVEVPVLDEPVIDESVLDAEETPEVAAESPADDDANIDAWLPSTIDAPSNSTPLTWDLGLPVAEPVAPEEPEPVAEPDVVPTEPIAETVVEPEAEIEPAVEPASEPAFEDYKAETIPAVDLNEVPEAHVEPNDYANREINIYPIDDGDFEREIVEPEIPEIDVPDPNPEGYSPASIPDVAELTKPIELPTEGGWREQMEQGDDEGIAASQGVGVSNAGVTANVLTLDETPSWDLTSPIHETGEILLTGPITTINKTFDTSPLFVDEPIPVPESQPEVLMIPRRAHEALSIVGRAPVEDDITIIPNVNKPLYLGVGAFLGLSIIAVGAIALFTDIL